jgi:hypothetical protein
LLIGSVLHYCTVAWQWSRFYTLSHNSCEICFESPGRAQWF